MKSSSRLRRRGFSLIETMIALFLTSAVLYAVGSLTQKTLQTLHFLREKSQTVQSATLGCERLATEMREMIAPPGISGSSITFKKVNPNAPPALDNKFADPSLSSHLWARDYQAAGQVLDVTYDVQDEQLRRSADGGPAIPVAVNVNSFVVTPSAGPAGAFQISLGIREQRRQVVFTNTVYCPAIGTP